MHGGRPLSGSGRILSRACGGCRLVPRRQSGDRRARQPAPARAQGQGARVRGWCHRGLTFDDAQKERLRAALTEAEVDHQIETYAGARHGWVPPDSAVHQPEAAERHWRTLFALLDAKLKS
ncbi:MAG TPA: dienelactone hydrolase family protein [Polyangiales bacterium]